MKKEVKRTIYLMLLAIMLFSASMSIPALYNSRWKDAAQGGAAGLMIAAALSILPAIINARKKPTK
jgi:hypothetical protein